MSEGRWAERIARKLEGVSPISAFLTWLIAGVVLILLSYAFGLASVTGPSGLRLGYLYEINWIWNFGFTVPCAVAGVFLTISSARQAVLGLVAAGMISGPQGQASTSVAVEESWYAVYGQFLRWAVWASVAGFAISYVEWASVSVAPLLSHSAHAQGWFVASLINGAPRWGNLVFGFLAYTLQGAGVALFLLYVFTVTAFASWVYLFTTQEEPLELLPDTASDDPRRGFQVLEPFVTNMLYCGLGFFVVFFVNRVHYLFVNQSHHPPAFPSVYQFFASEVLAAVGKDTMAIFGKASPRFFEIGSANNFTVVISTIGLFCVVGISVLVPITVLLQAAQRSRSRNLVFLQKGDPRALNTRRQPGPEQSFRLRSMQVWPVSYPKPLLLVALALVAATSYVFYRLTFVLFALCVVAAFRTTVRVLRALDPGGLPAPAWLRKPPAAQAAENDTWPHRIDLGVEVPPK